MSFDSTIFQKSTNQISNLSFDSFLRRKKSILSKSDKSSSGKWDEKIISLCEKINSSENYCTTSSCSGRVVLMIDQGKKSPNLFLAVHHDLISFRLLKNKLNEIIKNKKFKEKLIKFKCEPPILHVVCRDLKSAILLLEKAKKSGLKHSGIHSIGKNIVLEINGSDKLEFPLIFKGKILAFNDFLKLIIKQSNEKLKKGWAMIKKLESRLY